MRLDNAALIYPPCKSRDYTPGFRVSVTLKECVDSVCLQKALEEVLKRFPSSSLRVGYYGTRIDLDVFHAVTDGTGAMTFLMSLTAQYLSLRHNIPVEYGRWVRNPEDEPCEEEIEDSFDHFSGMRGSLDREDAAFAIKGKALPSDTIGRSRVKVDTRKVMAFAKECDCTVTELLAAVMLYSLQEIRRSSDRPFLRVEVPVNLRPIFSHGTLRDFTSYLHIGIDVRNGDMSLEDILSDVKLQKSLFYHLKGDKYCSTTLSNLGRIELSEEMAAYVRDVDFVLGRPLKRGVVAGCVSFGNSLVLNFTSRIRDQRFEQAFERNLESVLLGVTPRRAEI